MSILGGLSHPFSRNVLGHMAGDSFLTGGDLRGVYKNTISVDQVAAMELSKYTVFHHLLYLRMVVWVTNQEHQRYHSIPQENQFPQNIA